MTSSSDHRDQPHPGAATRSRCESARTAVRRRAARGRHDAPTRAELRRSLIGLEAALYRHFDEENQVFVPLLEHLTPRDSDALARQLEHAAVKGHEQ